MRMAGDDVADRLPVEMKGDVREGAGEGGAEAGTSARGTGSPSREGDELAPAVRKLCLKHEFA